METKESETRNGTLPQLKSLIVRNNQTPNQLWIHFLSISDSCSYKKSTITQVFQYSK